MVAVAGLLPSLPMFGAREISKITKSKDAKSFPTDSIQHSIQPRICATAIHQETLPRTTL